MASGSGAVASGSGAVVSGSGAVLSGSACDSNEWSEAGATASACAASVLGLNMLPAPKRRCTLCAPLHDASSMCFALRPTVSRSTACTAWLHVGACWLLHGSAAARAAAGALLHRWSCGGRTLDFERLVSAARPDRRHDRTHERTDAHKSGRAAVPCTRARSIVRRHRIGWIGTAIARTVRR